MIPLLLPGKTLNSVYFFHKISTTLMNYFLVKMITMIQLNKLKIKETCGTRFHGILIFEGQKFDLYAYISKWLMIMKRAY